MIKRYQVFVSSTYTDLIEERRVVFQTLLEMNCFPAGMEFFLAADEDQLSFIKGVIRSSDYYVLITGGRYGSMSESGLSYTEQEFDYAVSIGLQVLVFTHKNLDSIPVGKSDISPEVRTKLRAFLEKVQADRMVQFWTSPDELAGKVSRSLSKAITEHPADGWVRGSEIVSADALADLNRVRNENERLQVLNAHLTKRLAAAQPLAKDLQGLNDKFRYRIKYAGSFAQSIEVVVGWGKLFGMLAPFMSEPTDEGSALYRVREALESEAKNQFPQLIRPNADEQDLQTVKIQLLGLRLITVARMETVGGDVQTFWTLTESGNREMFTQRLLRKEKS